MDKDNSCSMPTPGYSLQVLLVMAREIESLWYSVALYGVSLRLSFTLVYFFVHTRDDSHSLLIGVVMVDGLHTYVYI